MSKSKSKKAGPTSKRPESMAPLRRALSRQKKAELVDTLLELAQADRGVLRQLPRNSHGEQHSSGGHQEVDEVLRAHTSPLPTAAVAPRQSGRVQRFRQFPASTEAGRAAP